MPASCSGTCGFCVHLTRTGMRFVVQRMAGFRFSPYRRALRSSLALAIVCCVQAISAAAQSYPDRPIRLVVAYPPGGGTDVTARIIVGRLSERLGRQVVIDNRPGAASTLGTGIVAKATPDGYTLLMSDTTF